MFATRSIVPPPSSPPSSPSLLPYSSPSSSPSRNSSTSHDEPPLLTFPPPLTDPFAACNKTSYGCSKRVADDFSSIDLDASSRLKRSRLVSDASGTRLSASFDDYEKTVWDEAIAHVVDEGRGTLDLSDRNLSSIPAQISELAHFVAISESSERSLASVNLLGAEAQKKDFLRASRRVTTAPADVFSSRAAILERAQSIMGCSVGFPREELQLFLAGNCISAIPSQLFLLDRLTVLSLRGNNLSVIPPAIAKLTRLRELHLSNNRLTYLPSEMLNMSLTCISLFPNPFLVESSMPTRLVSFRPRMIAGSPVSDTRRPHPAARVPELTELCLRVLIAPSASSPSVPNLTHHYGPALLPDPPPRGYGINPQLGAVLNACVPGSVADPPMMAAPNPPVEGEDAALGVSLCPSPKHDVGGWFVRHAEERFSWEAVVGGVGAGGSVPVRWRGCQVGCLDFMDGDDGEAAERVENAVMTINLQGGLDFEWGD